MEFELDQIQIGRTVGAVLSEANQNAQERFPLSTQQGQWQWRGAIAALEHLLGDNHDTGLILSSPSPVFGDRQLAEQYHHVMLTPKGLKDLALCHFQLTGVMSDAAKSSDKRLLEFPLLPKDPLLEEQFCLILTPQFSFAMVLAAKTGFQFSFDPQAIAELWQIFQWRMALTQPFHFQTFQKLWQEFSPVAPDYRVVSRFSLMMLRSLPDLVPNLQNPVTQPDPPEKTSYEINLQPEIELLQALTHEIRTPLTTIRTMTKLLLKKKKELTKDIVKRIETIEQECNEQIRRMELIFRAAELETPSQTRCVQLIPTSLEQLFQEGTPRWQKQAQRRNVNLDVILPKKLPQVVSDPAMLDQVLSGLIEAFTRRLPTGAEVQIQVTTAGNQLKLEVQSHGLGQKCLEKAIGQLLIFQPETGSLSLNLDVTKNLFQLLGGKLTIRHRASGEEVFTIFLPLGNTLTVPI